MPLTVIRLCVLVPLSLVNYFKVSAGFCLTHKYQTRLEKFCSIWCLIRADDALVQALFVVAAVGGPRHVGHQVVSLTESRESHILEYKKRSCLVIF